MKENFIAIAGAIVGGVVGGFLVWWLAQQSFYATILPGGLAGICAGFKKNRLIFVPIICGLLALAFEVATEWRVFSSHMTLSEFLAAFRDEPPITWIMIVAGTAIGFWVPFRQFEKPAKPAPKTSQTP
jgi:hypothetical protein